MTGKTRSFNAGRLHDVQNWVFDLDDTLYPRDAGLMQQIDRRMTDYVARHLSMDPVSARVIQKKFLHEYGTTLRGMMLEYKTNARDFLDFVHDIDYGSLQNAPELAQALSHLPGRKFIFTNGSVAHAQKIVERMGLGDYFSGIYDIESGDYIPKPQPVVYEVMIKKFGIAPDRSVILDDLVRNLIPAAKLGMTTVLVKHEHSIPSGDPHVGADYGDFIHHETDDMLEFLRQVLKDIKE